MTSVIDKPYERVQLFSGGGSRFGYYLGSYAALVEHDLAPDIIVGTCGGSLSALLVQIAPDPKQLQQLVQSRELYRVIKAIRHVATHEASTRLKLRYSANAIQRWRLSRQFFSSKRQYQADSYEQLLDELQQLAMFRVDNETQWLDELLQFLPIGSDTNNFNNPAPDIAIIASRLQQMADASSVTNSTAQLQELLFAPKRLLLADSNASTTNMLTSSVHDTANGRINQSVKMLTEWDMVTAVRASMADMYYLSPIHNVDLGWCLGGVINLTPIELACTLADTVFAETKAGYDSWLAAPAIKRIFGFDPNQRLAQVHNFSLPMLHHSKSNNKNNSQLHWLPFADNGQQLIGSVRKRFNLKQMTVELVHHGYDGFVQTMQAQWQYGYQRTTDYIKQHQL